MQIIEPTYNNCLNEDYRYAALNILWYLDNDKRYLIFANIELYPNEHPMPIELPEVPKRVGNKERKWLYFRRIVDTAENLINLYEDMSTNNRQLTAFWQEKKEKFEFYHYLSGPLYPVLSLVQSPPYLPDFSGCVRANFLFNQFFPSELKEICLKEATLSWINKQLNFDISKNQEYFGSIILSAYNPLIRKIHYRGGGELTDRVHFDIEPRNNVDISELELLFLEKRPKGFSSFVKEKLNNNIITIQTRQEIDKTGYAIICPQRGIIDWHEFCGFLKSINIQMNVVSEEVTVNIKNKDHLADEETYTVQRYSKTPDISVGDNVQNDILDFLHKAEIQKNKLKKSKNNTQKTFYDDCKGATEFVRVLIGKARERVIVIDPYSTTRELYKYLLSVTTHVDTVLLTSKTCLDAKTKQTKKNLGFSEYELLNKQCENLASNFQIQIYIMTGRDPVFHDRFLIIDNEVWLSGNSLADLGKRISTIVKLPNPEEIIEIYDNVIKDNERIYKLENSGVNNANSKK